MASLAELESTQIGERIKDVKLKNKEGKRTYSSPIFGYTNDKVNHVLVPNGELSTVRQIMAMKADMSYHEIAAQLNNDGVATKNNKRWYASTVYNICKNSIYA